MTPAGRQRALPRRVEDGLVLIWDLDGTILDTKRDIATGVNEMLRALDRPPLPLERVLRHVGRGVRVLVERTLRDAGLTDAVRTDGTELAAGTAPHAEDPSAPSSLIDTGVELFRVHYRRHMFDSTTPYPGIPELLRDLAGRGAAMAVVSNKPEAATRTLVETLGFAPLFRIVMGGDTLPVRKPDPQTLRHALDACRTGATPEEAILIGDSMTDLLTGRAAGTPVCGVGWGFDPDGEFRREGADWWVESAEELREILLGH